MKPESVEAGRNGKYAGGHVTADVRRALRDLRRFYDIGAKSLERSPGRMGYGQMAREAERFGLGQEMLRKARKFAEEYPTRELERLLARCERAGYPLGVSHVIRLLSVGREHRAAFQEAAVQGGWSFSRVEAEIRKRFGRRRTKVGRHRQAPEDPADSYLQITRFCEQWRRLHQALHLPAGGDGEAEGPSPRVALTKAVRERLSEADEAMTKLGRLASDRLKKGSPGEGE